MGKLEAAYYKMKGLGKALTATKMEAKKGLVEFVKLYGKLWVETEGVPHTVTDLYEDDCSQYQISEIEYDTTKGRLVVTTVNGERLTNFAFDDLAYLISDLTEECLEYAIKK